MNYQELFLDAKWETKKKEILKRDGYKCTICNNFHLIQKCLVGLLFYHGENYKNILYGFYGRNSQGVLINHKTVINKAFKIKSPHSSIGYIGYITEASEANIFAKLVAIREREMSDYDNIFLNLSQIGYLPGSAGLCNLTNDNFKWELGSVLHVHHNYYIKNLKLWEYPDTALKTMCWVCHEKHNREKAVNYLNTKGFPTRTLSPCKKCYGAGFFPDFKDLKPGVCPSCNGAKYEELINVEIVNF
jgi:hypothetical protein